MRKGLETSLATTTNKTIRRKIQAGMDKLNKMNSDQKILVTNPSLFDTTQKTPIDEIKKMNAPNIIKLPGIIIIR